MRILEVMVLTFSGTGIFLTSTEITCTSWGMYGSCRATVRLVTGSASGTVTTFSTCLWSITNSADFALGARGVGAMIGFERSWTICLASIISG